MAPSATTSPPALLEAIRNSTVAWQEDLQSLFNHAKERFADVVWELVDENNDKQQGVDEVWGHKGRLQISLVSRLLSSLARDVSYCPFQLYVWSPASLTGSKLLVASTS